MKKPLLWLALAFLALDVSAQDALKELDTPYVPTPQVVVDRMLDMAGLKAGETVIDLGSGDGRIMIEAASKYGARGFGVEIDPKLVVLSNERAAQAGVADRVQFLQQDLFKTDFHEANVLTLYLLPDVNLALRPKILAELRPGARVVSHDYGMGDWRPDAQETIPAPDKKVGVRKESQVFLWTVPAKVDGEWSFDLSSGTKSRTTRLVLKQKFQDVAGTVELTGKGNVRLSGGRVSGDELRLTLPAGAVGRGPVEMVGRVNGDTLAGTLQRAGREVATWSAVRK
ncbi:MAG TPA: methyltransferase domain-containing protein [Burkholderiales bacterium]|nr:methyltransferase domain-containing protein [Burkholderiales bacterium]